MSGVSSAPAISRAARSRRALVRERRRRMGLGAMAGSKARQKDVETDHVDGRDRLDRDRPAGAERLAHAGVVLGERCGALGGVGIERGCSAGSWRDGILKPRVAHAVDDRPAGAVEQGEGRIPSAIRVTSAKAIAAASSAMLNTGPRRPREWRRWRMRRSSSVVTASTASVSRTPQRGGVAGSSWRARRRGVLEKVSASTPVSGWARWIERKPARGRASKAIRSGFGDALSSSPSAWSRSCRTSGTRCRGAAAALEWGQRGAQPNQGTRDEPFGILEAAQRVAGRVPFRHDLLGLRSFGRRWCGMPSHAPTRSARRSRCPWRRASP